MNFATFVVVDFELEGFHRYKDAPNQVNFLRFPHRHIFQFKLHLKVSDLNREKEIFLVQQEVKQYLIEKYGYGNGTPDWPLQFGGLSCEMLAVELLKKFNTPLSVVRVEVLEDGKGGAVAEAA